MPHPALEGQGEKSGWHRLYRGYCAPRFRMGFRWEHLNEEACRAGPASLQSTLVKKETICGPALAFVFAWRRIGDIGAYEQQR